MSREQDAESNVDFLFQEMNGWLYAAGKRKGSFRIFEFRF